MKRNDKKAKQKMILLTSVLIGGLLTGCGAASESAPTASSYTSSSSSDMAYYGENGGLAQSAYSVKSESEYELSEEIITDDTENQTQNIDTMTLLEEKLVYHCDLNIETLDYLATIEAIKQSISNCNGVIQAENESDSGRNWYYADYQKTSGTMHNYLQVRIPSNKYDAFLAELDGVGKITSKSTSVENISQAYYDTTTQIEALQIQEKNLLSMLDQCETIEDMLTVQERLTQVQYELNRLQTNKRYMDVDVAYSYVNINVTEVMEYQYANEPVKTNRFVDRLYNTIKSTGRGFLLFLEGLLFLIIRLFPYIVILGLVCLIFRKKIRLFMTNKKAERERNQMRSRGAMQQVRQGQYGPIQNPAMMQDKTPQNPESHNNSENRN